METNLQEMEQDLAELMRGWSLREVMNRYAGQMTRMPYKEIVPFQKIIDASNRIWNDSTTPERVEHIRKEALELWESDREEEKRICFDVVSGEKGYQFTDRVLFEESCIKHNELFTELLSGELTEATKEYIRTETAGFTDRQILTMFDLSTGGEYWHLDGIRYSLLLGIYIARRSDELREKIIAMFRESIRDSLASKHAMKSPDDEYDKAKKAFYIPDEILQERAEYKLSEHEEYDLFRHVKHILKLKKMEELAGYTAVNGITKLSVSYPDYFEVGNGRFNKVFRSHDLEEFLAGPEGISIRTSENSKEIEGFFQFSMSETIEDSPLFSEDEEEEDRQYYLNKKRKLNEKYKGLNDRTPFFDDVMNAVGSCMTSCSMQILTVPMIYKFMQANRRARLSPDIERDIVKALYLGKELCVKITCIRGSKDTTIDGSILLFDRVKVSVNGQLATGYHFYRLPSTYLYNILNGDMTKRRMLDTTTKSQRGRTDAKAIYDFLFKLFDRYQSNEFMEYGYDKVIKDAQIKGDIDSTTPAERNRRSKLFSSVDNALDELKASGLIKDCEKRIETEESKLKGSHRKYYKFKVMFNSDEKEKQVKKKTRRKS